MAPPHAFGNSSSHVDHEEGDDLPSLEDLMFDVERAQGSQRPSLELGLEKPDHLTECSAHNECNNASTPEQQGETSQDVDSNSCSNSVKYSSSSATSNGHRGKHYSLSPHSTSVTGLEIGYGF